MDASGGSVASRKRSGKHYTIEDEALDRITKESEARLAARRQARVEARQLRIRELERQQQQSEENVSGEDASLATAAPGTGGLTCFQQASAACRRTSGDSGAAVDNGVSTHDTARDLRHELRELEEKLRKSMLSSAQLDNDKSTLIYQVQLLNDKIDDLHESHCQLQRNYKNNCSEHERLKRLISRVKCELDVCQKQLHERDRLITEHGLVMVGSDDEGDSDSNATQARSLHAALVGQSAAELLQNAGDGSLDCRLRRIAEEKADLEDQLRRLKLQLEEQRHLASESTNSTCPLDITKCSDSVSGEVSRQVDEYRFKLQKSEQEITNLHTNVQRLENQVQRYKMAAEIAEKSEEELKQERRKLQRELRESQNVIEDLETTNCHLKKRLDKLKNARSALLKDLSTD